jgi:hypothetical protein
LLVELWTLSQASFLSEVLELKDIRTTFRGTTDHLWGVNLNEIILDHEVSVKFADSRLKLKNGLIGWYSQVDDSVVKSDILLDNSTFGFTVSIATILSSLVSAKSACIINLEWKHRSRFVDHEESIDLQFNSMLSASLNWFLRYSHLSFNLDDGLSWNLSDVVYHSLADLLSSRGNALNGRIFSSHNNEGKTTLSS